MWLFENFKKIKNHGLKHIRTGSFILSRTVIMNNDNRPDNLLGYDAVWGWVFDFCSAHQFQFQVLEKKIQNQRTASFRYLKKFQNQRIARSGYLKTLIGFKEPRALATFLKIQRTARFHERPDKDPGVVLRVWLFDISPPKKSENHDYIQQSGIWSFENHGYIYQTYWVYDCIVTMVIYQLWYPSWHPGWGLVPWFNTLNPHSGARFVCSWVSDNRPTLGSSSNGWCWPNDFITK